MRKNWKGFTGDWRESGGRKWATKRQKRDGEILTTNKHEGHLMWSSFFGKVFARGQGRERSVLLRIRQQNNKAKQRAKRKIIIPTKVVMRRVVWDVSSPLVRPAKTRVCCNQHFPFWTRSYVAELSFRWNNKFGG
jgi:hypothetical protein